MAMSALILVVMLPFPLRAACMAEKPEGILQCLQDVFAARDSAAYGQLLTQEFCFVNLSPDSSVSTRDAEIKSAAGVLCQATSVRLTFDCGWVLSRGRLPGTWVLSGLTSTTSIIAPGKKPVDVRVPGNCLYLRSLARPGRGYAIHRWERPLE
jgi:hypothetical protein